MKKMRVDKFKYLGEWISFNELEMKADNSRMQQMELAFLFTEDS